jgi:ABC-type multidrug transport system ATPase subunit
MPIEFTDVSFRYTAARWVLRDLSFSFPRGSTILLGPNGAGKSTMLGLAASALTPRGGRVTLDNVSSVGRDRRRYRSRVTWMPQVVRPFPGLTVREQVAYVAWLKGARKQDAWTRSLEALRVCELTPLADRRSTELSGGQLRRLGVAQTVVHEADVVLMDEPTAGLDPAQRAGFRNLIGRVRSSSDLIVSTHQTEDIVESYTSVVVLSEGAIVYAGAIEAFLALAPPDTPLERRAESAYRRVIESASALVQ